MRKDISCYTCRQRLDPYIDQRLSIGQRRQVAHHLDHCAACYVSYNQRRELRRELGYHLPQLGREHTTDFQRVWSAIQSELPLQPSSQTGFQMRFGLAAMMLMVLFLLPFTMGHQDVVRNTIPPTQPAPELVTTGTPGILVTLATEEAVTLTRESRLKAMTAPPTLPEPDMTEIKARN